MNFKTDIRREFECSVCITNQPLAAVARHDEALFGEFPYRQSHSARRRRGTCNDDAQFIPQEWNHVQVRNGQLHDSDVDNSTSEPLNQLLHPLAWLFQ